MAQRSTTERRLRGLTAHCLMCLWLAMVPGVSAVGVARPAPGAPMAPQGTASPADRQRQADIERRLSKLDGRFVVEVRGDVVTLSGTVPSVWWKQEAVKRVLDAGHVASVVAEVTIDRAESDAALARAVVDRIRKYDRYTVYDDIQGRVRNGVVTVIGAVTAPEKQTDLLERIGKVRGVQDIDNKLEVLPVSEPDDRLRVLIASAIYRDQAFENYSMVDPPVHVIVSNGHVTLTGFVDSDLERIKAESIARSFSGVLAFDNKVQVVGRRR